MNRRRWLVLVLLASGIFYALVWSDAPWMVSDSAGYLETAADLRDLRLDALHDRTPGYPLILLATGASQTPARLLFIAQLLMIVASVFLLAGLLERAAVRKFLIAGFVILALAPSRMAPAAYVLTECWTQFLLVGGLCAWMAWFDRRRTVWLLAWGVAAGLAAFTRPAYALLAVAWLPIAILLERLVTSQRLPKRIALVYTLAPTLLLLGGLCLHNQQRFGYAGPSPLFGFNLSTRTLRVLERLPDEHATIREILIRHRDEDLVAPHEDHLARMFIWGVAREDLEAATGMSQAELSKRMAKLNLLLIRKAPLEYGIEVGQAMVAYWFPWLPAAGNLGSRGLQLLWSLLHFGTIAVFFAVVLMMVAVGCVVVTVPQLRAWVGAGMQVPQQRAVTGAVLALVAIFYTMLVSCVVEIGTPRYRGPTDLLILFVTVLGVELWSQWRRRANTIDATMRLSRLPSPAQRAGA